MLLAIEDAAENFHFFVADGKKSSIFLGKFTPRGKTTLYSAFLSNGSIVIIEEKGPEETIFHLFSSDGRRLTEKPLWPPVVSSRRCQVVDGQELLATQGNLILRYGLPPKGNRQCLRFSRRV